MKKPTLADAVATVSTPDSESKKPPSRRGKRAWVVYLDPNTARALKVAAAMSDRSLQSLGVEAADLMIDRYGSSHA